MLYRQGFTNGTSDGMTSGDKENEDIENPKKRVRGPPEPPARTTSKINQSQVLSPRSANSRTLPRSPIRAAEFAGKSGLARPVSPLKPSGPVPTGGAAGILTNMVEKAKSSRGATTTRKVADQGTTAPGVGRGKRAAGPPLPPKVGRGRAISDSSETSSGTTATIVRKPVAAAKKEPVKRTMMTTIKGMGASTKRAPAAKAAAPATGSRILRKRN
jgi:hypothetical protein